MRVTLELVVEELIDDADVEQELRDLLYVGASGSFGDAIRVEEMRVTWES